MIRNPARVGVSPWSVRTLFVAVACALGLPAMATPLQIDPVFDTGSGANGTVRSISRQSDGAIWIGGSFSTVQGTTRTGIAKLSAGGALDATFVPPTTTNQVNCVAADGTGKVLVGLYSMGSIRGIVRLDAGGNIDPTFDASAVVNYTVRDIEVLPSGNIIIGGDSNRVALLTPTGAAVPTFASSLDESGTVYCVQPLPSGKIAVGGSFTSFRGASRKNLCVLTSTGTLDATFSAPGAGPSSVVQDMALQPDGKLILAGNFYSYSGESVSNLCRISAEGTLDRYFKPNPDNTVYSVKTLPDGRILAGGFFTTADGGTRQRIALFRADGKADVGFDTTIGASAEVDALCVLPDSRIVLGGSFTTLVGLPATRIGGLLAPSSGIPAVGNMTPMTGPAGTVLQLTGSSLTGLTSVQFPGGGTVAFTVNSDTSVTVTVPTGAVFGTLVLTGAAGSSATPMAFSPAAPGALDPAFDVGAGAGSTVYDVVRDAAGRAYAAGYFSTYNGFARSGVVRILENGAADPAFVPGFSSSTVYCLAIQPDGKVLIGGSGPAGKTGIARLNADGSRDDGFDAASAFSGSATVYAVALQADGKILVGGSFTRNLARLNPNGSLDTSFNVGTGTSSTVNALAVQQDGKILVGGDFSTYNGATSKYLARLSPAGVAEAGFPGGTGVSGSVKSLALQQHGEILLAGDFYSVNGNTTVRGLARLRVDGTLDTTFAPKLTSSLKMVRLAADGRIAIAGDFTSIAGQSRNYVALLHADGKLVTGFDTTGGPTSTVYAVSPGSDGSVVIGGSFSTVAGQPYSRIARLQGDQGKSRPAVSRVSPESGIAGDHLFIDGSLLGSLTEAVFSGGAVASIFPISETRTKIQVPAGAMSGPITLRNAYGEGTSATVFKLLSKPTPVISSIPAAAVAIGESFVVTGKNFYDVTQVRLGVLTAVFTVDSATQMTVTVPANALTARVILTGQGGTAQSATDLIVVKALPVLTSAPTATGVVGKNFTFTLTASNGPTGFTASPLPAGLSLDPVSGKISGVPTTDGTTTVTTSATNLGGTGSGSLAITIAVPPAPTVASVSPSQVPPGGRILVTGNNLFQTTGVTVGGVTAVFAVLSDTRLAVTLPPDSTGGTIVVTTSQGMVTSVGSVSVWDFQGGTQTVTGFGDNASAESTPPAGLNDAIAISAGLYHSLALRADGRISGWGGNSAGQATPPATLAPAVGISAGGFHSLALQADGTVAAWGRNDEGQCGIADLANVAAISAGGYHSLALLRTGQVKAWGANTVGQATVPDSLGGVVAIAAGFDFSAALRSDGKVVCWGANAYGQCDVPTAAASGVVAISAGQSHMVALKSDGTVIAWGADWTAQSSVPAGLSQVTAIAAGSHHTLALRADGTVVGWGANWRGQRTIPNASGLVVKIAAGGDHSLFLKTSAPIPAISGPSQVTGKPGQPLSYLPTGANGPLTFSADGLPSGLVIDPATGAITGSPTRGADTVVTLTARNTTGLVQTNVRFFIGPYVIGWGTSVPGPIPALPTVVQVAAGYNHCIALMADGTVTGWGSNSYGERTIPTGLSNIVAVAAGNGFSLALKADGSVYGWGQNLYSQSWGPGNLLASNMVTLEAAGYTAVGISRYGTANALVSYPSSSSIGNALISATPNPNSSVFSSPSNFATINRDGAAFVIPTYSSSSSTPLNSAAGLDQLAISGTSRYSNALPSIWGLQRNGVVWEFQQGSRYSSSLPKTLATPVTDGVDVAAGDYFSLILRSDASAVLLQATPDPSDSYGYPTSPFAGPPSDTLVGVTGVAASYGYALAIKNPVASLRITSGRVLEGRTGSYFSHQVTATGAPTQYSATFLPTGLVINATSGLISGTPTVVGTTCFLVIAKSPTGIATQAVSIKLTNGVPPFDLTLTGNTIAEDAPKSTTVGTLATMDYSPSDTFTYALVTGTGSMDNAKFSISGNVVKTNTALDYEALPTASIRVQVTDSGGNTFAKVFLINITDVTTDDDDGDGLTQAEEALLGTNPRVADTDQDGASDGQEISSGTLPLDATSRPANYVAAWGQNTSGQCTVPRDLGPVVAVAAGGSHSLALREDGTVAAWGNNGSHECDVPGDLSDVVAIAAGANHSLALKSNGEVVTWGTTSSGLDQVPAGLSGVIEIAANGYSSAALTADGQVVVWGETSSGLTMVPPEAQRSVHIGMSSNAMFALRKSGGWVAWGNESYGQLSGARQSPDLVSLIGSDTLTLGVTADGQLKTWGTSTFGANQPPANLPPVLQAAAGSYYGTALGTDGSVTAWGYNSYGQSSVPPGLAPSRMVSAGSYHTLALCGSVPPDYFLNTAVETVTGVPFNRQLSYSGTADQFDAKFLPPGVSFDPLTASLTGTLAQSGSYNIRFTATKDRSQVSKIIQIHSTTPRNFTDWRTARGGAGIGGLLADPDGDSVVNLLEYALMRDPTGSDPSPATQRSSVTVNGNSYLALTYKRLKDATDLRYLVEVSGDLSTWSSGNGVTADVSIAAGGDSETVIVRDTVPSGTGSRRFIRLRVEQTGAN